MSDAGEQKTGLVEWKGGPLNLLRRFATARTYEERCELCTVPVNPDAHRHLVEVAQRTIVCACDACALRFHGVIGGRFKLIPRDIKVLTTVSISDQEWDNFAIPINLAFFFHDTPGGKITAMYPSPAGATECLLPLERWEVLIQEYPFLATMESDVEALLINRVGAIREYYITPIDLCYELVGLIRTQWRGLSGGERVWKEIDLFFNRIRAVAVNSGNPEVSYAGS